MNSSSEPLVVVGHSSELGGAELGLIALSQLTVDFSVVLLEDGPLASKLAESGTRTLIVDLNSMLGSQLRRGSIQSMIAVFRARKPLRQVIGQELFARKSKVLVVNTLRAALILTLVPLPKGTHYIYMARDGLAVPYLKLWQVIAAQIVIGMRADLIIANSRWTRSKIYLPTKIGVVPPLISKQFFGEGVARERPEPEHIRVLILGRLAPWKGQIFGIHAARKVATNKLWSLRIAGGAWFDEHTYEREIIEAVANVKKPPIELLGHVQDVVRLLDESDIVIHTSIIPEPFGQVVAQAMARGKLVIVPDEGGPAEQITDGVTGLIYTMGSVESLAAVLSYAINKYENLQSIRKAASAEAEREYQPELVAARLVREIGRLL